MRRSSVLMIALIAVVTSVFAAPAQAQTRESGRGGKIVAARFSALNGGNPQIVAVNAGSGHIRLLTTGHRDAVPDVSPDGRSIVFERCLDAVDCDQIGKINIWVMRASGSRQHPLTSCDGSQCLGAFDPAFSPNGRLIAFSEDRLDAHGVNFNGIFTMHTDGTHLRRLTSSDPDGLPDGQPAFSPDGRSIVFQREVPDGNRLMIVHTDGTGLRSLLYYVDGSVPSWAPSGERIAFALVRHGTGTNSVDIATVRPDGSGLRVLTDSSAGVASFAPDYSPHGSRLVFSRGTSDGCPLVISHSSGNGARVLTPAASGCYVDASWGGTKTTKD